MPVSARAIKPKATVFDVPRIEKAVIAAYQRLATLVLHDFEVITRTWSRRPRFIIRVKRDGFEVRTDDQVFKWVDEGTPPHRIMPRRPGGFLRFQTPFRAKSVPGVIGSGSGGTGDTTVFSRGVDHPGTKAREFTQAVQKKLDRVKATIVQEEISKALQ